MNSAHLNIQMNKIPQIIRDRNIDPYDGASKLPSVRPQGRREGHTLRSQGRRETLMRPSVLLTTEMMGASHSNSIMLARLASLTVPGAPDPANIVLIRLSGTIGRTPLVLCNQKQAIYHTFSPSKFFVVENFPVCRRKCNQRNVEIRNLRKTASRSYNKLREGEFKMRRKNNFHAKKTRIAVPYGNERTKKNTKGKNVG